MMAMDRWVMVRMIRNVKEQGDEKEDAGWMMG